LLALNGTEAKIDKTLSDGKSNDTEGVWSPDGKQIVFISDRDGVNNVYIMDADGSHIRQLTQGRQTAHLPTWAPDGKRIAYSITEGKKGQVLAINVDGTNSMNLTRSLAWAGDPAWSPDGKHIALAVNPQGFGVHLYVMDVGGSNSRVLSATDNPLGHVHPSWSPDGKMIAFGDYREQRVEIIVCEADGTNQKQITHLGGINTRASWSPDGTKIAFRHFDNAGATNSTLFLMQADGSNLRPIQAPVQGECKSRLMWKPR
jgi:TolB protein